MLWVIQYFFLVIQGILLMSVGTQCLTCIVRGWYLLTSPGGRGGSTAWFGGFWAFFKHYLDDRFGAFEYCMSAESSLNLHAGDTTIPTQIIILTKKESNTRVELLHKTSIFLRTDQKNFPTDIETINGVPVMPVINSLCRLTPSYFHNNPRNVEVILKLTSLPVAEISRTLLKFEALAAAEKLIGAFQHLKEESKASQIQKDLEAAGYVVNPTNPFKTYEPQLVGQRISSPYAGRIKLQWNLMREEIVKIMPEAPGLGEEQSRTMDNIWETYKQDAYHSLSIEGYHVTEELIEKIGNGKWDPGHSDADKKHKDAMAAIGYFNSFQAVTKSIEKIFKNENPGQILENDLQTWYRELFSPLLQANLLPAERLAGYRNQQVYITSSRHVPPPRTAILDCMEVFFDLLKNEPSAMVRSILGHFIFVYIHPYMDGNGRIGRFIMNLMLVSGGFNWTVLRVGRRAEYMAVLEKASTEENIIPFTEFVLSELMHWKD